jgi:Na+/H+ antiporter NhaD/arsenite permease-like protein
MIDMVLVSMRRLAVMACVDSFFFRKGSKVVVEEAT